MKEKVLLCFICLCFGLVDGIAQMCGTHITAEQQEYLDNSEVQMRSFDIFKTRGIIDIPIQAHIVTRNDGSEGLSLAKLKAAVQDLNTYYVNANIRFVVLDHINYISNDNHFNFNVDNEELLGRLHDVKNVINLYITNSITSGTYSLCGYAYFPPGNDRIVMSKYCVNNGSTMPHEFGHYFMLYHTHGPSNNGSTDELVDGSNCAEAGDKVCDTPADPNLSGKVSDECRYIGKLKDVNGQSYKPDTYNMMSYASKNCRKHFSKGQYARINNAALNHRGYLKFPPSNNPKLKNPIANTTKLSGQLILEMAGQAVETELDGNLYKTKEPFYTGTNFQLFISNNESAYVYVLGSNLLKENSLLFPLKDQSAFISKGRDKFALPGNNYLYQLDKNTGKDYFCVLYSKKPLNINRISRKMEVTYGTFMQRLYKVLGNDVVPLNQIKYSKSGTLDFSANSISRSIVPIVVEVEHL